MSAEKPASSADKILTYMSIRAEINAVLGEHLFLLAPALTSAQVERTLLVNAEVFGATKLDQWEKRERYRLAVLRADLDRFIIGDRVSVMLQPKKKPATAYLKRLKPIANEVWEIRSCDPRPGVRVLGRFSEPNTFVALCWEFRESIWGDEWDELCDRCLNEWIRLFPNHAPYRGNTANDYVSRAFSV